MRIFLFLVLLLIIQFQVYAEGVYFDLSLKDPILSSKNVVDVEMKYNLGDIDPKRFRVRPVVKRGIWQYVHTLEGWEWVDGLWTSMPHLYQEFKIRIDGLGRSSTDIYFLVQDTKKNAIYETPKRKIWGFGIVEDYFEKLNSNIFMHRNDKITE